MSSKILVAYASRTGTTAGVAEVIGQVLAADGTAVDVRPVAEVNNLSPYSAIVVGSAIQGAEWLPEAMQFIRDHQRELAARPFAAFLVCMTLAMTNRDYHDEVARWLQPVCDLVEPVSMGLFAGALDISKVPTLRARLNFRISVRLGVWSEGDHRDWAEIRAWAEELRPLLAAEA
ncbi:MAG TPA: flavodoxin domain-containing protein [Promineifilum sp.]|nr:flavodoxin domain-containing protein [Promineifilum sp.]